MRKERCASFMPARWMITDGDATWRRVHVPCGVVSFPGVVVPLVHHIGGIVALPCGDVSLVRLPGGMLSLPGGIVSLVRLPGDLRV